MVRAPKSTPPVPKIVVSLKKFGPRYARSDARRWLKLLVMLYRSSVIYNLGLHEESPDIRIIRKDGRVSIGQIGKAVVELIGPRPQGFSIPHDNLPSIIVNIDAPDPVILRQFKLALAEARKYIPAPVEARGRSGMSGQFDDKKVFKRWKRAKIVELGILFIWNARREKHGQGSYPDHVLGEWLGLGGSKETSVAKRELKKALKSIPSLFTQVSQDLITQQVRGEAIRSELEKGEV
jgi:hypothetical protein